MVNRSSTRNGDWDIQKTRSAFLQNQHFCSAQDSVTLDSEGRWTLFIRGKSVCISVPQTPNRPWKFTPAHFLTVQECLTTRYFEGAHTKKYHPPDRKTDKNITDRKMDSLSFSLSFLLFLSVHALIEMTTTSLLPSYTDTTLEISRDTAQTSQTQIEQIQFLVIQKKKV